MIPLSKIATVLSLVSISISTLMIKNVYSQEVRDFGVVVSIQFDATAVIFSYSYAFTNPDVNSGQVGHIEIDISRALNGIILSGEGLVNGPGFLKHTTELSLQDKPDLVVPVGLLSPLNWVAVISGRGSVSWGNAKQKNRLLPGQTLSGFLITSRGLPSLRDFTILPRFDPPSRQPGESNKNYLARVRVFREGLKFKGRTLGPDAPASLEPSSLVDRLISLKHQSKEMGWIFGPGVEGIERSLDAKLNAAKESISKGNNNAAQGQLKAFINELEAQRGKHMNDNTFFLLETNSEFIISKLGS